MISMIIVDYKSIKKTLSYIKHVNMNLINIDKINYIIVDNYGDDSALKILKKEFAFIEKKNVNSIVTYIFSYKETNIVYCQSGVNLGYAKGNNLGVLISDAFFVNEYYIISNNDLLFENKFDWNKIYSIYEADKEICVIGPRIINKDGSCQSPNKCLSAYDVLIHQYLVDFKPFKWKGDLDYTFDSKYCYRVSGCFMIVKAKPFKSVGMFDEHTFLYGEEMILSERLEQVGAKVYFCDDLHLLHNHGETIKNNANSKQMHKWCYESYAYYFKKYRNTSNILLRISKYIFNIYLLRRGFRDNLKSLIKNRRKG